MRSCFWTFLMRSISHAASESSFGPASGPRRRPAQMRQMDAHATPSGRNPAVAGRSSVGIILGVSASRSLVDGVWYECPTHHSTPIHLPSRAQRATHAQESYNQDAGFLCLSFSWPYINDVFTGLSEPGQPRSQPGKPAGLRWIMGFSRHCIVADCFGLLGFQLLFFQEVRRPSSPARCTIFAVASHHKTHRELYRTLDGAR